MQAIEALNAEHETVVQELEAAVVAKLGKMKDKLANEKATNKTRIDNRDQMIGALEFERRRLINGLQEMHMWKANFVTQFNQCEAARVNAEARASAAATQLATIAAKATSPKAGASGGADPEVVLALQAQISLLEQKVAQLNSTNAALANQLSGSPEGAGMLADAEVQGYTAAEAKHGSRRLSMEVAQLTGSAPDLEQIVEERNDLRQQLASLSGLIGTLQNENARVRFEMAEAAMMHKLALAEAGTASAGFGAAAAPVEVNVPEVTIDLEELESANIPKVRLDSSKPAGALAIDLEYLLGHAKEVIRLGETLWVDKKKRQALKLYQREAEDLANVLPETSALQPPMQEALDEASARLAENVPAKAGMFTVKCCIVCLLGFVRFARCVFGLSESAWIPTARSSD
jgi:prefoldin subunit 5